MTYLLTGATGLIGSHLVRTLLASGHAVNYLGSRRSKTLDSRASFHRWDRGSAPDFGGMPRLDAVIHLAGEPISQRWTPAVKQKIQQSRVDGTRQLVAALRPLRYPPSVLVSASAVGFYGDRGEESLDEDSSPGSGFLADVCVDWEREALRAQEFGLRVVLIRIAMVLSPQGGALKQMLPAFRFGVAGKFGTGRQWLPWIHLDDLVRLFIFAAETPSASGPLNGCSPQTVRNSDFTRALAATLHRPAFLPIPKFALNLVLGELAAFILGSQHVFAKRTQQTGFVFEHPEIGEALRSLLR